MDQLLENPLLYLPQPLVRLLKPLFRFWAEHRHVLLLVIMIGGVLVAAPAIGALMSVVNPILIFVVVAVPIAIVGLAYTVPRPEYGPILILIAGLYIPISLPTGTESRLVDSFLLTLFFVGNWIFKMVVVDKKVTLAPTPSNKPLLWFAVVVFFSIIWSALLRDPLANPDNLSKKFVFVQFASALTMVMLPGAFLLVANHIHEVKWLKLMVILMVAGGAIGIVYRLGVLPIYLVNDSGLFTLWVVSISVGLIYFNNNLSWKWKAVLAVIAAGWLYFRFVLQISWLAGWLPSVVAVALLTIMRSKKLFITVTLAVVLYLAKDANYYFGTVVGNETDESGNSRVAAWEANWTVTGKHLIFGTGPAGYAVYYMSYFPDHAMATHNNIIDILAQTGVVGLSLVLWFFGGIIWQGYKLCLRLRGRRDFVEALANIGFAGAVGCLVMMVFGDWLFPFTYTQTIAGFDYVVYSWLFMGVIPVIDRLYPATATPPAKFHPIVYS